MIRRPPRSTQSRSSAASDVYKRQVQGRDADGRIDRPPQVQWLSEVGLDDGDPVEVIGQPPAQFAQHLARTIDGYDVSAWQQAKQLLGVAAGTASEVQDGLVAIQSQLSNGRRAPMLMRQRQCVVSAGVPLQHFHGSFLS